MKPEKVLGLGQSSPDSLRQRLSAYAVLDSQDAALECLANDDILGT
jgi:hypothetical protein